MLPTSEVHRYSASRISRVLTVLASSSVVGCGMDVSSEVDIPSVDVAIATGTQSLTVAGASEYIESHYCEFVDRCCNACDSAYVRELLWWDATTQAYATWSSSRTALRAALLEQAARQALNVALTLVNRDISSRAYDSISGALQAWRTANRLGELSSQLLVLRESVSAAIGLLASGLVSAQLQAPL